MGCISRSSPATCMQEPQAGEGESAHSASERDGAGSPLVLLWARRRCVAHRGRVMRPSACCMAVPIRMPGGMQRRALEQPALLRACSTRISVIHAACTRAQALTVRMKSLLVPTLRPPSTTVLFDCLYM